MNNKNTIYVSGMRCKSCEIILEDELGKVPGVDKSKADHKKGIVEISYDSKEPDRNEIESVIRKTGYSIGKEDGEGLISKNPSDYRDLGLALLALLGIYFIAKSFGFGNLNFAALAGDSKSLGVVFLVGLTAGVSTCMALVGGLVLGISARYSEKHPEATGIQRFRPHLYFNLGRIIGFALLGGILGALGSVLEFSSLILGVITIAVGAVLFLLGLQLIEIFPRMNRFKLTIPKPISCALGMKENEGEYSHKSSVLAGALTFFLPCGFTQAAQLLAVSSGSFLGGAMIMGMFALGTVPGLLGVGGLASSIRVGSARKFFKFVGLVVIFFALFNIANGYNLIGLKSGGSVVKTAAPAPSSVVSVDPHVTIENGFQAVKMAEDSAGYSPAKFTIKKGIPVRWVIEAEEPYSCAASLVMPKFNINKHLSKGENVIEFTPTEAGTIKFSCSMGMYTGAFSVVD